MLLFSCWSKMNLFTLLCYVMFVGLTEGIRTRRAACEYGTYTHEGNTCCLCPEGSRVKHDCDDKKDTECELCEDGSYTDHPNNDHSCQPCKICNPNANMEVKEKCSRYSNTICKCLKNHYCEKGEQCYTCTSCDKCEEVKTECTETNNTVCKEPIKKDVTGVIAASVLVLILGIFLISLFCLWKRNKSKKSREAEKEELEPLKKNVDLNPYLPEIADTLGWKIMKRVAQRSGMNKVSIENHECNHPNDARERTNELLQEWYQTQGLYEAYPALFKNLYAIKERTIADKIKDIIEKSQDNAQP
ncbi:tumor necrosis factor receptor superfamily member 6 [Pseudorasbora parva]|uniref:tumor necrosis factor receptor superfamily member 6 n=1 Tax=Pseudorasbora parva TaxID=51549 RepID=UPI00351DD6EF